MKMEAYYDSQMEKTKREMDEFRTETVIQYQMKFGDPLENVENQYRRTELPEIYKRSGETKLDFAAIPTKRQGSAGFSFAAFSTYPNPAKMLGKVRCAYKNFVQGQSVCELGYSKRSNSQNVHHDRQQFLPALFSNWK